MFRRALRLTLAVLVATALTATTVGSQTAAQAEGTAGPPYDFVTEITYGGVIPLKNQAMITRTAHGLLYRSGQQDGHLVVTPVPGGLRFADSATREWKKLAPPCRAQRVAVGVAAVCKMPDGVSTSRPLLLEVWPRLGDDFTDGSRLPATVAMSVLGDAGNDVARLGAGPDFFNGASGNDRVFGGGGNDWLRTGLGNDRIWGGPGHDQLAGVDGRDVVYGGSGDDKVGGGAGNDRLFAGDGQDFALCGTGADAATVDGRDRHLGCESLVSR